MGSSEAIEVTYKRTFQAVCFFAVQSSWRLSISDIHYFDIGCSAFVDEDALEIRWIIWCI